MSMDEVNNNRRPYAIDGENKTMCYFNNLTLNLEDLNLNLVQVFLIGNFLFQSASSLQDFIQD